MLVVDASVIAKILIDEPLSDAAVSVIRTERQLLVPAHAFAEVGEVVSRKIRSGFVEADQLERLTQVLEHDFIVAPIEPHLRTAIEISVKTGASVYDCLYVALAAAENCPLVTADNRLMSKMKGTQFAALLRPLDSSTASP